VVEPRPDGSHLVRLTLGWPRGDDSRGEAVGHGIPEAIMRAGAEATLAAIAGGPFPTPAFHLRGVRAVRAFDHRVIIVAIDHPDNPGGRPLIGSVAVAAGDLARGGVLSTLDAVNRIVEASVPGRKDAAQDLE